MINDAQRALAVTAVYCILYNIIWIPYENIRLFMWIIGDLCIWIMLMEAFLGDDA